MKYLNALNKISGVGAKRMQQLIGTLGSAENAWRADFADLKSSKIGEKLAEKIASERKDIDPDREWEILEKENIRLVTLDDPQYPKLLKNIFNPPYIIYIRGAFDFNSCPAIAVVGSRKATQYGIDAAEKFSQELARSGFAVISGLALGIDAAAHQGALDMNGKTVGVLGSSIDDENISPRTNFNLAKEIIATGGALISDFPPKTSANNLTFPARNRLIAGLSLGTLVVEAAEGSGALITAKMALEYDREVFAVPGNIFSPNSPGVNKLIGSGAKIAMSVQDVLEEFDLRNSIKKEIVPEKNPDTKEEGIILGILSVSPLHIDNIGKLTKLDTPTLSSTLSMMEIKGWVKNVGGQNYISI